MRSGKFDNYGVLLDNIHIYSMLGVENEFCFDTKVVPEEWCKNWISPGKPSLPSCSNPIIEKCHSDSKLW